MNIYLEKHPVISDLFVVVSGCFNVYFKHVSYDPFEKFITFERDDEIVTGRIEIDSNVQLEEWKQAFVAMNIELEYLEG